MNMTDRNMKFEAMMHLEFCTDSFTSLSKYQLQEEEIQRRLWAANYLVQAMMGGPKPENFNEVIQAARDLDAKLAQEQKAMEERIRTI